MAITISLNGNYTLDETAGLQSGADGTPSGSARDDSDVAVGTLPGAFSNYLFTTLGLSNAFPLAVGAAASASNLINVATDGTLSSLGLTDSNGDPFAGTASGLTTTDGDAIYLWSDLDNQVVLGKTAGGDVAFAVYMEPNGPLDSSVDVKLWSVTFEPLDHPTNPDQDEAIDLLSLVHITATGSKSFNFDALPSGQNLFGMVGDSNDAIVCIGELPLLKADGSYTNTSDTINTSKGGGPTTIGIDNQMFDPVGGGTDVNDGAFFTYVEKPNTNFLAGAAGGLNQNEADLAQNVQFENTKEVNGAFLKIVQVVGNGTSSLSLTAYDLTDDERDGKDFVENGMGAEGGTKVDIDAVSVYMGAIDPANLVTSGISISFVNGVASVSGLQAGMIVVWHTSADHDQVLVQSNSGSAPFDIGLFGLIDGETESASLAGRSFVEDDGPSLGPIADSTVLFAPGQSATQPLSDSAGTDGEASLTITDYTQSVTLLGKTIVGVLNGAGTEVHYFEDKNGSGGFDAGDVSYYTLALTEPGGVDSYTFTVNNAPAAPPLEFNFAGLPSGQNLFGMVASAGSPDGPGCLFFGENSLLKNNGEFTNASDTINTSQGGGPTTIGNTNQMVDAGEGIYFTIINNPEDDYLANVLDGLDQNEADDADNIEFASLREVPGAFLRISQTQGNEVEACTVEAFNITKPADDKGILAASGHNHVDITSVSVYNGSIDPANLVEKTVAGADSGMSSGVTITIDADGVAHVTGLEAGYLIAWETDGNHDQVLITGTAGKFDIGGFGLAEPQQVPDHALDFEVTLTDGDGDPFSDSFRVTIDNPLN